MKNIIRVLLMASLLLNCTDGWANSLNYYRNLLTSKKFHLEYQELTPQERQTNRDRISLTGSNSMKTGVADFLVNMQTEGIVVEWGNNRYEEVGSAHGAMCRLKNGYKVYNFTKRPNNGKVVYYGKKKGEVEATAYNQLAEAQYGRSYGTENMSMVLNALLPNNMKPSRALKFQEVGSGKNKKGLNYIDYKAESQNETYVIRYCFEGSVLSRIFSAKYYTNSAGRFDGKRNIFKIKKFTHEINTNYLRLPEGLKVVGLKHGR